MKESIKMEALDLDTATYRGWTITFSSVGVGATTPPVQFVKYEAIKTNPETHCKYVLTPLSDALTRVTAGQEVFRRIDEIENEKFKEVDEVIEEEWKYTTPPKVAEPDYISGMCHFSTNRGFSIAIYEHMSMGRTLVITKPKRFKGEKPEVVKCEFFPHGQNKIYKLVEDSKGFIYEFLREGKENE